MAKKHIDKTQEITNYLFWIFLLQGVTLVLLGFWILIDPAVLFILVSVTFIWNGITTFMLAWRVRRFWKEVPELFE